jgi:phage baseplate assembly protein W
MNTSPHLYQYPIQATKLMAPSSPASTGKGGGEHPTQPLGMSIAQFLHLLLHTRPGELRSSPTFGCAIWDLEFDNDTPLAKWETLLTRSLLAAVREHEPRLTDVQVQVQFAQAATAEVSRQPIARRQANITVRGVVALTGEAFRYATQLYLGQLTV